MRVAPARTISCVSNAEPQMIRFLFRLLSTVALAIGFVMAVLDATRTVAASAIVMTPLATSWAAFSPGALDEAEAFVTRTFGTAFWDPALTSVLALPGWFVFAVLSLLFYAIGREPVGQPDGFALKT